MVSNQSGDMSLAEIMLDLDLESSTYWNVRFIMGNGGNDYWNNYDLEYSTDGQSYTKFKAYSQNTRKKTVELKILTVFKLVM